MKVSYSIDFIDSLRRLPPHRQKAVKKSLEKFMLNSQIPSLKFRQLKGIPGHYIINGSGGDRIILEKLDEEIFEAVDCGPHDNIYRIWDR